MQPKDKLKQLTGDERLGMERDSEYLGAEDIDDGTEPILTISGLYNGMVTLQRGKENKDVLAFVEDRVPGIHEVRPMIVNATNRKTLRKLYGDAKANTLVGKKIQLYIDHRVRNPEDGGLTDGIRIRPNIPKIVVIKCEGCGNPIQPSNGFTAEKLAQYTESKYGKKLCAVCAAAAAKAAKSGKPEESVSTETATQIQEAADESEPK
jgi:hypothetical protein